MDPKTVPGASATQNPQQNNTQNSSSFFNKFKNLTKKQKILIGGLAALILIAVGVWFFYPKEKSSETTLGPDSVIARIGDTNVYQGYVDTEWKLYPATKSAEVKEQLKQKVIDDQITLVEAKKEGLIQDFNTSPDLTDEQYLERVKLLRDLKQEIEQGRDSISGSLISIGFFQGDSNPQILSRNKQLAFSKISPVYERVKNKEITLEQGRQILATDSAVRRLDPNIAVNVQTRFNKKRSNQITYWQEFNEILWATEKDNFTPLYIGKTADRNGNPVEAVYVFGYIFSKGENKGYDSYNQWLEEKRKLYSLVIQNKKEFSLLDSLIPAFEVFAQDMGDQPGQSTDTGGNNNDNGGNGNDGNLSNQNHTLDNNVPTDCYNCDPQGSPILAPSWAGTVVTETGAKLPGANIAITCTKGSTAAVTGADGNYNAPAVQSINHTCNPIALKASYGGITCEEKQVNVDNTTAVQINNFTCNLGLPACNKPCPGNGYCEGASDGCNTCRPDASGVNTCQPPPACGATCTENSNCAGAQNNCTACVPADSGTGKVCAPPPACNVSCTRDEQCAGAGNGCTACMPADTGGGKVCRPPAACNVSCTRDEQCEGAGNGCISCLPGDTGDGKVCRKTPACGVSCTKDSQCAGAFDGCGACRPADNGPGNECRLIPACGVACTKDSQCAGAKDGCSACVGGFCKTPPACGVACNSKSDCVGAKEGCTECLEGTCTNYNDNMCKCDGLVADMVYPSTAFKFEAFGKVEGGDTKKAEIADITFRMTKDNQVIAKSDPITPSIVENSANKMRFRANWQTAPPKVSRGSTYRVFADVRCKPKRITATNGELASASINSSSTPATVDNSKKLPPPKGLVWIVNNLAKLFGGKVNPLVGEVMAQLSSPSPAPSTAKSLQLSTLNFVKLMDTDNCRFVMFKFDETLF